MGCIGMWKMRDLWMRLRALLRRRAVEQELDDELRSHFEQQVEKWVASGVAMEEARRRARLMISGAEQIKEECRDARGVRFAETSWNDMRFALRMLRKTPGVTAVAVLSLALGIGANTAIFSLIDAVMLRALPVARPDELLQVRIHSPQEGGEGDESFTNPLWEQLRDQQDVFAGVFAWWHTQFDLTRGGSVHYVNGAWVSGDFFSTLGRRPVIGRLIAPSDDHRGCAAVAVLGYGFWQEHCGGATSVLGGVLSLSGHPLEVIGVAPPGFNGLEVGEEFEVAAPI